MKLIFETKRLFIRLVEKNDAAEMANFYLRNKEELKPYEPKRDEKFYTPKGQRQIIKSQQKKTNRLEYLQFSLAKKSNRERIIGFVSFSNIIKGSFCSSFVGYKIDKDEKRKGYMFEALKFLINEIAFKELNLHRIEANIMPHNIPSLKLVQKLGFNKEGYAKDYLRINGKWQDHIHMVKTNNGWMEDENESEK